MKHIFVPTCPMPPFVRPLPNPWMDPEETNLLMTGIFIRWTEARQPLRVLEVGTNWGITAGNIGHLLRAIGGQLVTVDVKEAPESLPKCQLGELPGQRFGSAIPPDLRAPAGPVTLRLLEGPDFNASLEYVCKETGPFDVVLLDGDHSEAGTRSALSIVGQHVYPEHLIFLHDCWWEKNPPPVDGPLRVLESMSGSILNLTHMGLIQLKKPTSHPTL